MEVSERLLSRLWLHHGLLPTRGRSTAGEAVELVYRGRWSHGVGPDFRDALVVLGHGPLQRGEVEIHIRASDWQAHGHHRDPRYDSVILHVVMWDDLGQPALKANGEPVPTIALSEHLGSGPNPSAPFPAREGGDTGLGSLPLAGRGAPNGIEGRRERSGFVLEELARIEAELLGQPWPSPDEEAPCSQRPSPPDLLAQLLERAGEERLRAKAARFEADLAAASTLGAERLAEQALYVGLAEALGYRANQRPFRQLAAIVPLEYVYSLTHCESPEGRFLALQSLLFGAAGLLPSQRPRTPELDWEAEAYAEELERRWLLLRPQWGSQPMSYADWTFAGVRPPNYPTRRIATLSQLLSAQLEAGLLGGLTRALFLPDLPSRLSALPLLLEGGPADSFWSNRCDFGRRYLHGSPRLLGSQRTGDIVVNVLLPFALAWSDWAGQAGLAEAALEAYRAHPPLAENEITKEMIGRLSGANGGRSRSSLANSACRQQGLLHLYRLYCQERRCLDCPVLRLGR